MTDVPPDWIHPPDLEAARLAQHEIAERAEPADRLDPPSLVAGVDCAGAARGAPDRIRAMAVLLEQKYKAKKAGG